MEILALTQMLNTSSKKVNDINSPKKNGVSFKQLLSDNLEPGIKNRGGIPKEGMIETLLDKEVDYLLGNSFTFRDVFKRAEESPSIIGVLSIIKVIEGADSNVDLSPIITLLNNEIKGEYKSYSIPDPVTFETMNKSLLGLDPHDKAILNLEVLLSQIYNSNDNGFFIADELQLINQRLTNEILNEYISNEIDNKEDSSINYQLNSQDLDFLNEQNATNLDDIRYDLLIDLQKLTQNNTIIERLKQVIINTDIQSITLALSKFTNRINKLELYSNQSSLLKDFADYAKNMSVEINNFSNSEISVLQRQAFKELLSRMDSPIKYENSDQKLLNQSTNLERFIYRKEVLPEKSTISSNRLDTVKAIDKMEENFIIQLGKYVESTTETTGNNSQVRRDFTSQLLQAFKTSRFSQTTNGSNRLVIKLNPEHLGTLTVRLIQKNGEMVARIIASSDSAKELLEHSIHQLRQALPSMQVEIDRFDVANEQNNKFIKDQNPQKEEHNNNQNSNNQDQSSKQDEERTFSDSLNEILNIVKEGEQ